MARKVLLTVLTVAVFAAQALALGGGTSNADFLKIGVGARPTAMGEAFAGVADDSNAAFWNPAGLGAVDKWSVTLMHLAWFLGSSYEYASVVAPIDNMTNLGASVNYFWIKPFNSTVNIGGTKIEADVPGSSDMAITISGSRILGNFYTKDFTIGNITAGVNITYIQRDLMGIKLKPVYTLDLGVAANITDALRAALVLQDIGTTVGADATPFNARLGLGYDHIFSKDFNTIVSFDVNKPIDITNPEYQKWYFNAGAELNLFNVLSIRGGYKLNRQDETYTVGGGLSIPDTGSVDYAFVPHKELGDTHRISLSLRVGSSIPRPVLGGPLPPQKINALAGDKIVSVGWEPNPEANIIGYNIYYREKGSEQFSKLNKDPIMEEAKFNAVLKNDIAYEFAVTAINNRNLESIHSDKVEATPAKYVAKKPPVVTGLFSKVQDSTIVILWDETSDRNSIGYNIYYKKEGAIKFKLLNKKLLKDTKATLAGLASGTQYHFMVTAVSKDGLESDFSEVVTASLEE